MNLSRTRNRCSSGTCRTDLNREAEQNPGKILFRFPRPSGSKAETHQKWLDFVRVTRPDFKPQIDSYLCSDHFTFDCIALRSVLKMQFGMKTRPVLKPGSIPTIQKETILDNSPNDSNSCTDDSSAISTSSRSKRNILSKEKHTITSDPVSTKRKLKLKVAKPKTTSPGAKESLKSKSAKKTSHTASVASKGRVTKSSDTTNTCKSKSSKVTPDTGKTSITEENNFPSCKRLKKTQKKIIPNKKRKLTEKPEVVIERWEEDDEEEAPPDEGEDPLGTENSTTVKKTKTVDPKNLKLTEQGHEGEVLTQFFETHIDPSDTENFIKFQKNRSFRSYAYVGTNTTESVPLKCDASTETSFERLLDTSKAESKTEDQKKLFGTVPSTSVVCKTEHPGTLFDVHNIKCEEELSHAKANDILIKEAEVLKTHSRGPIKQEIIVPGGLNVDLNSRVLSEDSKASVYSLKMTHTGDNRCDLDSVDLHANNVGLLAAGGNPVYFAEKGSGFDSVDIKEQRLAFSGAPSVDGERTRQDHPIKLPIRSPSGPEDPPVDYAEKGSGLDSVDIQEQGLAFTTSCDGERSRQDLCIKPPIRSPSGPEDMLVERASYSDSDSFIALPVDEEQNMIFCCSTCGDVQSVEGDSRLVIFNDMTVKMTNTLTSEVMSVFCEKCSTESESCFHCNEHIERGSFKDHLKLHFG